MSASTLAQLARIRAGAKLLLREVSESYMIGADAAGVTRDNAVLGCAAIALMAASAEVAPDADQMGAAIGAVVNLARSTGMSETDVRDMIADRLDAAYGAGAAH